MGKVRSREVSDEFWSRVEPLIPGRKRPNEVSYKRKLGGGRKPMDPRKTFEGIVFVLHTGCQWKALPKEGFGSASSVHKYFREWLKAGFFLQLWRAGLAEYDEMKGIAWKWQSIDGSMVKAPLAQESVGQKPNGTGGKSGSKRHVLVDGNGILLSLIVTGANRHDVTQLALLLDAAVFTQSGKSTAYLYADKGYDGEPAQKVIAERGYAPRVCRKERRPGRPWKNRRWVVEVTHSWFNWFRKLLVRYEKLADSYEALLHSAAEIIYWRKVATIYG
ncbi:MAG: IS5 family transposase [Humidesulfovibrio sp.]|nr:IS5 family transposase [Humidesulfovibrio sp.]